MMHRRDFLKRVGGLAACGTFASMLGGQESKATTPATTIRAVTIQQQVLIEAADSTTGRFPLVDSGARKKAPALAETVQKLLVGRDPFDPALDGEAVWETLYPGKAKLYAEGRDPLTGEVIANKPRGARHSATGAFFIACSAVDLALWDLRARLKKLPGYRLIGTAARQRLPIYWRPGEPKTLADARKRAREAYDQGYHAQKWYFLNGPKEGQQGLKDNIELVRVVREELPEARLMFDNHKMRHLDDVDYAVQLARALLPYKLTWLEEPVCPEHVDGYAKIKGETGIPLAGGEHLYTRWPVQAFLERKCLDFVQSDPTWCGGISEWLRICAMVKKYPGVKVVPHITSPWVVAPQVVASQPEDLCPICEYNVEGGKATLDNRMQLDKASGEMRMIMTEAAGLMP